MKIDIKHVIFDLDGTIIDSKIGIVDSLKFSLTKMSMSFNEYSLENFIGYSLEHIYRNISRDDNREKINDFIMYYREHFAEYGIYKNTLYKDVSDIVKCMHAKGIILSIASIKPAVYTNEILRVHNLKSYFSNVVGSGLNGENDDKGILIGMIIKKYKNLKNENFLMVGDRKTDINGAKQNGILSAGVLYGYGEENEISSCSPDFIFKSLSELNSLI